MTRNTLIRIADYNQSLEKWKTDGKKRSVKNMHSIYRMYPLSLGGHIAFKGEPLRLRSRPFLKVHGCGSLNEEKWLCVCGGRTFQKLVLLCSKTEGTVVDKCALQEPDVEKPHMFLEPDTGKAMSRGAH